MEQVHGKDDDPEQQAPKNPPGSIVVCLLLSAGSDTDGTMVGPILGLVFAGICAVAVIVPPIRKFLLYLGRPLSIVHDATCVQESPDPNNPWQQVRLRVESRWGAPASDVRLKIVDSSDSGILSDNKYLKLVDDNQRDRFLMRGRRICSRRYPEMFDVAVHRPQRSSVIEYTEPTLREGYGTIPSFLYPWWIRLDFEAHGLIPSTQRFISSRQSYFLEIQRDGRLFIHPAATIDETAVIKPRPANVAEGTAYPPSAASGGLYVTDLTTLTPAAVTGVNPASLPPGRRYRFGSAKEVAPWRSGGLYGGDRPGSGG